MKKYLSPIITFVFFIALAANVNAQPTGNMGGGEPPQGSGGPGGEGFPGGNPPPMMMPSGGPYIMASDDPLFVLETASQSDAEDVKAYSERIEDLMPEIKYKPKKKRKLLVYIETASFRTPGEPYVDLVIDMLADKTDAFEVTFSSDIDVFLPENLNQYDAFLLNSTVNMKKDGESISETATPEICQSILDFVESGKGIIAMHGAVDNFNEWIPGQVLTGNKFTGHPWNEMGTWAVKIDEPNNVLTAPYKGQGFKVTQEIYETTSEIYSRDNQLVLMSLDMNDSTTAAEASSPKEDVGFSWIRNYGGGRVFYTVLGHGGDHKCTEFEDARNIEHLLLGIQWALGDIDGVDATPKGSL